MAIFIFMKDLQLKIISGLQLAFFGTYSLLRIIFVVENYFI